MDFRRMRKLRIGYWPLSPTLSSAGDRRRLIFGRKQGVILLLQT